MCNLISPVKTFKFSPDNYVVVEQQLSSDQYRFLLPDNVLCPALTFRPN